ncbi:leucine-rich repeat protein [Plasmodium gonderi]|uniref:Leucine-rich repeat protein n=1 Tax=Plasmodium gonderi TaxID=77519 RepID=A0A1Y1JHA2_PLAGO|nr:leucine-rich repeat protein [Plasmodium gonderi]GAW80132.1 leucine-rich repeat protein [Plasmodium gonderi]
MGEKNGGREILSADMTSAMVDEMEGCVPASLSSRILTDELHGKSRLEKKPGSSFIYIERTVKECDPYVHVILNFKKLKLNSEESFSQMVRENCERILDDLENAEIGIRSISTNIWKALSCQRNKNNKGIKEKKKENEESGKLYNIYEKKSIIVWELDLSYNFFTNLSIDNILFVLIQNKIINEMSIFNLNNLTTINLQKNMLTTFPHCSKYKLMNLLHFCLSHNEICKLGNVDISQECEKYETESCEENFVEMETIPIYKIKTETATLVGDEMNSDGRYVYVEGILNESAPNLTHLYLQNNKIMSLQFLKYLLNGHKNISHINLSFNMIKSFNYFPFLKNLKNFDLSFNTQLTICYSGDEVERKRIEELIKEHKYNIPMSNNFFNIPIRDSKDLKYCNTFLKLKLFSPNLQNVNLKHTPLLYSLK